MRPNARLWLIRDRFIAGHLNCALQRHLDSVLPETPIRDIVDRCRVWESHAGSDDRRIVKPMPERARTVHTVREPGCGPADQVVAAVIAPSVGVGELEALLRGLLSNVPVSAPPPRVAITDMATMLQRLLPGTPMRAQQPRPVPIRSDWTTIVCFSCGKSGHEWAGARS